MEKRRLEIQILKTDRWQKRYLWPLTNISALITVGTLIWSGILQPVVVAKQQTREAKAQTAIEKKKVTVEERKNQKKDSIIQEFPSDPNKPVTPDQILRIQARISDTKEQPKEPVQSAPVSELASLIKKMFSADRSVGKRTLNVLKDSHSEDVGFISQVVLATTEPSNARNLPGLINAVDVLMYVPRYRFSPFLDEVSGMISNVQSHLDAAQGADIKDIERLKYDLQLLRDRVTRVKTTGRG